MCGVHQLASFHLRGHLGLSSRSSDSSTLGVGGQCDVDGLMGAFENFNTYLIFFSRMFYISFKCQLSWF